VGPVRGIGLCRATIVNCMNLELVDQLVKSEFLSDAGLGYRSPSHRRIPAACQELAPAGAKCGTMTGVHRLRGSIGPTSESQGRGFEGSVV
jgi:hypothetical protein